MKKALQIFFSLLLASIVMYYLYHDFPFSSVSQTLSRHMEWHWIVLAMAMGGLAQFLRALRWQLLLKPLGANCELRNVSGAVFTSFALSLLIPRIGEVSRCATLRKTNGVSFSQSIGTVVAERIADTLVLLMLIAVVFCWQWDTVMTFFPSTQASATQTNSNAVLIMVLLLAVALIAACGIWAIRRNDKFKSQCTRFKEGLLSVVHSGHPWLFVGYSALICLFNLLNLWLMFYAFSFTSHLGAPTALLSFCMIAFAMVIPTPNGAGPWHYVVMTCLILCGVSHTDASTFALIVHALHMLTIVIMGVVGMLILRKRPSKA